MKITVDQLLTNDLLKYSFLTNKWAAYHQWFCVNGNGMEWKDGCLNNRDGEDFDLISTKEEAVNRQLKHYFLERLTDKNSNGEDKEWKTGIITKCATDRIMSICNFDDRKNDLTPRSFKDFYPIDEEYSLIMNIPDDIEHDWLCACVEFHGSLYDINLSVEQQKMRTKISRRIDKLYELHEKRFNNLLF
jgi:hypothetical protein